MYKRILFLFIFVFNFAFAQDLYVDDNSFLYSKNTVVFVNNDIRLETETSNIFFRGNAQLIQNIDTKNSDLGALSIYQNQTTGVYEYNYFCSPVGVSVNGTIKENVPFDGSNIHDPLATDLPYDNTELENVVSSPYLYTTAYEGTATEIANYWIYSLRDGEGYWSWKQELNTGAIETGYGFTLKGSPNTNNVLDFRGRPNNGNILVSCAFDGTDDDPSGAPNTAETLTGNPYPSVLDLKLFLTDGLGTVAATGTNNRNILNNEIYFWEQKPKNSHNLRDYEGGYGVYVPGVPSNLSDNGTYAPATYESYNGDGTNNTSTSGSSTNYNSNNSRRYAAVGQGFIIQSLGAGGNATFTNSMRLYLPEDSTPSGNGSIFAKKGKSKNETITEKKEIVAMSHNGVDYKTLLNNPTIIPEIRIQTHINNTYYKENVIAFRESTPNNNTFNRFYDGSNINDLKTDAYLISEDKALVIKSIKYSKSTRLSFGLKASKNNTNYNITINNLVEVPKNVEVFIFDNETNTYTDLKNGTFNITLNKGIYNKRFEITFSNNTLDVPDENLDTFKIFQNNKVSELYISNLNNLKIKSFSLYDVSGKQVITDMIVSNRKQYNYSTKALSSGVYIVKVNLENNQIISKKVIINNTN